ENPAVGAARRIRLALEEGLVHRRLQLRSAADVDLDRLRRGGSPENVRLRFPAVVQKAALTAFRKLVVEPRSGKRTTGDAEGGCSSADEQEAAESQDGAVAVKSSSKRKIPSLASRFAMTQQREKEAAEEEGVTAERRDEIATAETKFFQKEGRLQQLKAERGLALEDPVNIQRLKDEEVEDTDDEEELLAWQDRVKKAQRGFDHYRRVLGREQKAHPAWMAARAELETLRIEVDEVTAEFFSVVHDTSESTGAVAAGGSSQFDGKGSVIPLAQLQNIEALYDVAGSFENVLHECWKLASLLMVQERRRVTLYSELQRLLEGRHESWRDRDLLLAADTEKTQLAALRKRFREIAILPFLFDACSTGTPPLGANFALNVEPICLKEAPEIELCEPPVMQPFSGKSKASAKLRLEEEKAPDLMHQTDGTQGRTPRAAGLQIPFALEPPSTGTDLPRGGFDRIGTGGIVTSAYDAIIANDLHHPQDWAERERATALSSSSLPAQDPACEIGRIPSKLLEATEAYCQKIEDRSTRVRWFNQTGVADVDEDDQDSGKAGAEGDAVSAEAPGTAAAAVSSCSRQAERREKNMQVDKTKTTAADKTKTPVDKTKTTATAGNEQVTTADVSSSKPPPAPSARASPPLAASSGHREQQLGTKPSPQAAPAAGSTTALSYAGARGATGKNTAIPYGAENRSAVGQHAASSSSPGTWQPGSTFVPGSASAASAASYMSSTGKGKKHGSFGASSMAGHTMRGGGDFYEHGYRINPKPRDVPPPWAQQGSATSYPHGATSYSSFSAPNAAGAGYLAQQGGTGYHQQQSYMGQQGGSQHYQGAGQPGAHGPYLDGSRRGSMDDPTPGTHKGGYQQHGAPSSWASWQGANTPASGAGLSSQGYASLQTSGLLAGDLTGASTPHATTGQYPGQYPQHSGYPHGGPNTTHTPTSTGGLSLQNHGSSTADPYNMTNNTTGGTAASSTTAVPANGGLFWYTVPETGRCGVARSDQIPPGAKILTSPQEVSNARGQQQSTSTKSTSGMAAHAAPFVPQANKHGASSLTFQAQRQGTQQGSPPPSDKQHYVRTGTTSNKESGP
ncbi:unnamed protein product, partial [Amoebophrya sp. A25]